jgi:uncharacterized protein
MDDTADPAHRFTISRVSAISGVDAADWDSCADAAANPFLSHAFLDALEQSGSATPQTGWAPQHLILQETNGGVLGVAPTYLKSHSQGEYVFDHAFADAYERAGGDYYPKVQVAIPFTPVGGNRLLVRPDADAAQARTLLARGLLGLVQATKSSSAHITFMTEAEQAFLTEAGLGFLPRLDIQFHWEDRGYVGFDDFLATLPSRKRKGLKRERRDALGDGITIRWLTGGDITEAHWDAFFDFYQDTGARKWGTPYLTRDFFSRLGAAMADRVLLIFAERDGQPIAGALNLIGADTLYGRYWGCIEDHPFLHFEVCYYQAIDFALANGLRRVEAGAQGRHKLARGYEPRLTYSAHAFAHPGLSRAVADYLQGERLQTMAACRALADEAPGRHED